jgi:beta-glucosidase
LKRQQQPNTHKGEEKMFNKKRTKLYRGLSAVMLSGVVFSALGYGIANTWRSTVDSALGTKSYVTNTTDAKYTSTYKSTTDLMNAAKALSVREGAEGTVIMKNSDNVFPLSKTGKVALFGAAAYNPYMSAAGNTDQVKLEGALTAAGFTVDPTMKAIYGHLAEKYTETKGTWGGTTRTYTYGPNTSAGDYDEAGFQIKEANPDTIFTGDGQAATDWKDTVKAAGNTGIVVFSRPGGEGSTYRPGIARNTAGETLNQNPLAFSPEELAVIKAAKDTCDKVVVLLNSSNTLEVGPLMTGDYAVNGIAYIGIPNDYQFTGIVQALDGDVNPTGALADTYAISSTSSPAMKNFGGYMYTDYDIVGSTTDARYPGETIANTAQGSFGGGSNTYNGGMYVAEAEGIYTGYNYYETRYYDSVLNQGNATSTKGSSDSAAWSYAKEVAYPYGFGLSYLPYEEKITDVKVDKKVGGKITATISITNKGTKDGKFLGQLYVQTPYTAYDKANKVEKSAIQFLTSEKLDVKAGETGTLTVSIPTKYMASYDYTTAKTYILDGGKYYFSCGNGSHDALNNILAAQNKTGDASGVASAVKTWDNGAETATDTTTFSTSDNGTKITNVEDKADLNYYLPGTVTYLSRSDWDGTYPVSYDSVKLADSAKKDDWIKELRGQTYTIKTDEPVTNVNGTQNNVTFSDVTPDAQKNINDPFWDKLTQEITVDQAVGAVLHGGSQSDILDNVKNPVVVQNDGPMGFNSKSLSTNNGTQGTDPYYVDKDTTEGKFLANINSQSLLGTCFSPKLAEDWGEILGNTGLWIGNYQIWGAAVNYHRDPYNGRNTEYPSEDPMLSNILGAGIIEGSKKFGIIVGPKHIGFNDQEHNRSGISVYLNEQKFRETDIRGFQGAIEDQGALGLMVAFNRIGATNASADTGLQMKLIRDEWGFTGLSSTDMMSNSYYFNPESCIMAGITQMADFAGENSTISGGKTGNDATWSYISVAAVKNDATLVNQARQDLKYQLYAFSNSAIMNVTTTRVTPSWEAGLKAAIVIFSVLSAASIVLYALTVALAKKEEN